MPIYNFRAFQVDTNYYQGADGFVLSETTLDIFDTDGSLHQTPTADPDNDQTFSINGGPFSSDYQIDFQDFSVINGGSTEFEIFAFSTNTGTPSEQYFVFSKDPGFNPSSGDALTVSNYNLFTITDYEDIESSVCLAKGTWIDTAQGPRKIETLQPGDLLWTADRAWQPVQWISHRHVSRAILKTRPHERPIRFAAGHCGGLSDLLVSQLHAVHSFQIPALRRLYPDHLVRPRHLAELMRNTVRVANGRRTIDYYHILMPHHELVRANGMWVESLRLAPQSLKALGPENLSRIRQIRPGIPRFLSPSDKDKLMPSVRPVLTRKQVRGAFADFGTLPQRLWPEQACVPPTTESKRPVASYNGPLSEIV